MSGADDLQRLASLAGVLPSYRDAWGEERQVPLSTQRALLSALGLPANEPDEVRAAIRSIEERPYRTALDRAVVTRRTRSGRVRIPVSLSTKRASIPIAWRFEAESGRAREGRLRLDQLDLIDQRSIDGETIERRTFVLPFAVAPGYHRFHLLLDGEAGSEGLSLPVIVVPQRCYAGQPGAQTQRMWGMTLQLYGLRSRRNWGIGDFTDLASMAGIAARLGASAVGLNPLHALFPANPAHASPYSPSHRQFLCVWNIDIEAVADLAECDEAQKRITSADFRVALEQVRALHLVDYEKVAALKRPVLELLYDSFRGKHLVSGDGTSARVQDFRRFQREKGESLEQLGLFQALSEHFGPNTSWPQWPAAYRSPRSPEVADFARSHRKRIEFFHYLQWQAAEQLAKASMVAGAAGMAVGLYHDLALAPDAGGAEAWANQSLLAQGARLGAPPDDWNQKGQNWGLPPYNPLALTAAAYRPFAAVIRANMQHGGALRIDHAMGLERMYWIPEGADAHEGGYVRYPVDELIGILALESQRQKCLVIAEDLGTLPQGFHERMRKAAMLSYRLLYFTRDAKGGFLTPRRYPHPAAVAVATHDLATLAGYWRGRDLEVRSRLGLYPSQAAQKAAVAQRAHDRRELIRALKREGLLASDHAEDGSFFSLDLALAVYRFLARTPARLLLLSPADVLGDEDQVNMPGTVSEYPNWRATLSLELERLERDPRLQAVVSAINEERKRHP